MIMRIERMLRRSFMAFAIDRLPRGEKGFLLVAALTLLSALTLLGTTAYLLSATDIKIGGNFRNNQMALHVAMAGAERARQAFRIENMSSSDAGSLRPRPERSKCSGPAQQAVGTAGRRSSGSPGKAWSPA